MVGRTDVPCTFSSFRSHLLGSFCLVLSIVFNEGIIRQEDVAIRSLRKICGFIMGYGLNSRHGIRITIGLYGTMTPCEGFVTKAYAFCLI